VIVTRAAEIEDAVREARAEAELALQSLLRLQAVTASLAGALTPAEVSHVVVEQGLGLLDAVAGSVLWATTPDALEVLDAFGLGEEVAPGRRCGIDALPTPLRDAYRTGRPVWLESGVARVARHPGEGAAPGPLHGACAVLPLVAGSRVRGVLAVEFEGPRAFAATERSLALAVADQAAQALERAHLYAEQQRLRAAAERAAEFRRNLLAIVGHDLRNPLAAIVGFARVLTAGGGLDERKVRALARIEACAGQAAHIANDLLDLTRVESGRGLSVSPRGTRVDELCAAVAAEAESACRAGEVRVSGAGDPTVQWDPERVGQALSNLVVNALKHGAPDRPVTITWDGGGDPVRVSVHNWGPPIPPELRAHLFEPLRQGPDVGARLCGVGLGLYIASEIARAHGGTIAVRSEAASGTEFTLELARGAPR
jgi:signal transduction histidine kinase